MPELGDGGGSGYPGAIDSNASLEYNNAVGNRTRARADVPNDLAAAIVAIETTLGVNPHGTRSTVVSWLQQEHTTTGAHNDAYVVTTSGVQSITGQKTFAGGINVGTSGFWGTATAAASGFVRASGGNLLLADNAGYGQSGGGEVIRIIRGSVDGATGAKNAGTGFTSVRTSTGAYTVTFLTAFRETPSVLFTISRGSTLGVVRWATGTPTEAVVNTYNMSSSLIDNNFEFVAVGPV